MKLVDSHCHLDCLDLSDDNNDVSLTIKRANEVGVSHFLCVCIKQTDFEKMKNLVVDYPCVSLSVGTHPNEVVLANEEPTVDSIISIVRKEPKVVAIGETGLDYFRTEGDDILWQQNRFRNHIRAARETNRPLIVHSRQAREDTLRILKEEGADQVGGVLHCFTENWEMAKQAMDLNFYISFSGIVTFNNAIELQEVAKKVPLERLLIETDSPYLAPIPFRGKSNQPAYVRYVAEKLAQLKNQTLETIAHYSTDNFFSLFKEAKG